MKVSGWSAVRVWPVWMLAVFWTGSAAAGDIAGRWSFVTGRYADVCSMNGTMTISPPAETDRYACSFVTHETCGEVRGEVEQSCAIVRDGTSLTITSRITSIRLMEPHAYGYAPDDWHLTIVSHDEMTGFLDSYHDARARFFRSDRPVS